MPNEGRRDVIVALDVSTSCTGICVLSLEYDDSRRPLLLELSCMDFKGCKTVWQKADFAMKSLEVLGGRDDLNVVGFVLEEPLLGFTGGKSSASTITSLIRFNGILSYIGREVFGLDPVHISAAHARKMCGIKLVKKALGGPQKEQVFKHMTEHDLQHVLWPVKKSGKTVDWSRDATDAYVIARCHKISMGHA